MTNLLAGLFDIVVAAAMILVFFRFMIQFAGITAKDAFAKPIYRMTRIVDVFGRIFPTLGHGRINTASLVLLFLLRMIFIWGVLGMMRIDSQNIGLFYMPEVNLAMVDYLSRHFSPVMMFFVAAVTLLIDFLRMCQYIIIGSFIGGWVMLFTQKMPAIFGLLTLLSEPIIQPFRKVLPATGMLDLAPMLGFFLIILLETLVQTVGFYLLTL